MVQIDWKSRRDHVPPSGVHGWLTKLRGIFSFDRHLIRKGNREIQDATEYRNYMRDRERRHKRRQKDEEEDDHVHREGWFSSVFGRRGYYFDSTEDRWRRRRHPFMHIPHRCRPWYHGDHHRFLGFVSRQRHRTELGRSMRAEADRERRRERRRRERRLRYEGLAIREGGEVVVPQRHHSGHHHRRQEYLVSE